CARYGTTVNYFDYW
nr:immunoglobulin heavy chain junction region [Mus musculus]